MPAVVPANRREFERDIPGCLTRDAHVKWEAPVYTDLPFAPSPMNPVPCTAVGIAEVGLDVGEDRRPRSQYFDGDHIRGLRTRMMEANAEAEVVRGRVVSQELHVR